MFISYLCISFTIFFTCAFPSLPHPFLSYLFSIYPLLLSFMFPYFRPYLPSFIYFPLNYIQFLFPIPFLPNFLISSPSSSYMSSPPSIHPSSVFCLHQILLPHYFLPLTFLCFLFSFHFLLSLSLLFISFHIPFLT